MAFKWRDGFSCNIAEIDNQHKKLFEIGSRIFYAANLDDGYDHYDEIIEVLNELKAYTIYHFEYEENLMRELEYEKFDTHKVEHDFFVKKIERIERKDIEGQQKETITAIIAFVADWVSSHILKTDMEYKELFNAKGVY